MKNFLETVYKASLKELKGANIEIKRAGIELGLNIEIGDNFNWCITDEDVQEQAVHINKDFLKLLKSKSVQYPDTLDEDFLDIGPDDLLDIRFTDDSGTYLTTLYVGMLDVGGTSCLNYWIDFNNIEKVG